MISQILAIVLSAASLAAAQSNCTRSYTVKENDYCDLISAAQNVSTYQLAVDNYQTVNDGCTNLQIGQQLCLGLPGADCTTTYVVQENDYCDLIASNFNINSTILSANNPQIDDNCYNLYVGEVLCVAPTVLVTPAPAGWNLPGASLDSGYESDGSSSPVSVVSSSASVSVGSTIVPPAQPTTTAVAVTSTSAAVASTTSAPPAAINNAVSGGSSDEDSGTESDSDDDLPDCDDN